MDKKRLALLATLKEDGIVNTGVESDGLEIKELVQLAFGAIMAISERVSEKLPTDEERRAFYNTLTEKFGNLRDELI